MKILLIHHLEPVWSDSYIKFGGLTFAELCEKAAEHIDEVGYDRVILTQYQHRPLAESYPYEPLIDKIHEIHQYLYGWHAMEFADGDNGVTSDNVPEGYQILDTDEVLDLINAGHSYTNIHGTKICKGGFHSQVVIIEPWIEALKGHDVFLCGAFEGECIEDMEVVLRFSDVTFTKVYSLII